MFSLQSFAENKDADAVSAGISIQWHEWSNETFAVAAEQNKLVLLDISAEWCQFCKKMKAVTSSDVLAAAKKYLHPDKLVFLIVGDPEAMQKGSDKHDDQFSDFGSITILPLRDPMTLEAK